MGNIGDSLPSKTKGEQFWQGNQHEQRQRDGITWNGGRNAIDSHGQRVGSLVRCGGRDMVPKLRLESPAKARMGRALYVTLRILTFIRKIDVNRI